MKYFILALTFIWFLWKLMRVYVEYFALIFLFSLIVLSPVYAFGRVESELCIYSEQQIEPNQNYVYIEPIPQNELDHWNINQGHQPSVIVIGGVRWDVVTVYKED